ncbi:lipopolysaccharide biosynthesis protein [Kineococcus glutinatus]|uniref:Oligosaccharide flippase family protein n=1 Tax=Kineococcus glutinatus TaxID=1070872 RepID=A0ABP9HAU7_9ACTN
MSGGAPADPAAGLGGRMVRGVGWSAAQAWLLRLTTMGAFVLLGRLLEPADFGLVALASAFVSVLQAVTEGGFSSFLVQRATLDRRVTSTAFWTALGVSAVCAGALVLAATPLAAVFGEPQLAPVLVVLAAGLPLVGFGSVQWALLQREMRFRSLAVCQTVAALCGTAVVLVLALGGAGVWALVAQNVVTALVTSALLWRCSSWRPALLWDRAEAGDMLSFSWKVLAGNLLVQFRDRAEQFIIAAVGGAVLLGYWTIATRIVQILMELSVSVIQKVMLPAFSVLRADPERLHRLYRRSLTYTALLVVPVMLLAGTTSYAVVPLVFGEHWRPSADVAAVMALSGIAASMNYYDRAMYLAHGRPGTDLLVTSLIVPLHVLVVLLTAPHGLVWVAIGTVLRTFAVWPLRLAVLKRVCGLPWSCYGGIVPLFLAALPTAGVVELLKHLRPAVFDGWGFVLLAAVGGTVYAAVVLLASRDVRHLVAAARDRLRARRRTVAAAP